MHQKLLRHCHQSHLNDDESAYPCAEAKAAEASRLQSVRPVAAVLERGAVGTHDHESPSQSDR